MVQSDINFEAILHAESLNKEDICGFKDKVYGSVGGFMSLEKQVRQLEEAVVEAENRASMKSEILVLGICYWILGKQNQAIKFLSELKTRKIASYYLAKCYKELGDYEKALDFFGRSNPHGDEEFGVQIDIAETERMSGNLQEALKMIQTLSKKHDNNADLHCQWGYCLDERGEYEKALAHYDRALDIASDHSGALFRLAYNYDLDGEDAKAIEYYEKCVGQAPTYTNAIMNLGVLYEDREEYEKAISCFAKVVKLNPVHQKARLFLKDARFGLNMCIDEDKAKKEDKETEVLNIPISDFELSVRSKNCLERMNINTLVDLTKITETDLLSYKNFGETSLNEIKHVLSQKGLRLGQSLEEGKTTEDLAGIDVESGEDGMDMDRLISDLPLSTRCKSALKKIDIEKVSDVVAKTGQELLDYGLKQIYLDELEVNIK
ncbi:MAG: tetratricopeptide repeat protein, partial [Planctomycetes bacterium]|nr:tetratricopeptide repeat protein [Planctomycetota bacterium]